ncbi:UNVERIFIED_CONTAM: hypothetical protein HDU68_009380 [Siphonaria sp. JEL0065]|nr:hypothetical protein HDU68_009380 [Siphonaria sp. JEL0065]
MTVGLLIANTVFGLMATVQSTQFAILICIPKTILQCIIIVVAERIVKWKKLEELFASVKNLTG